VRLSDVVCGWVVSDCIIFVQWFLIRLKMVLCVSVCHSFIIYIC
jgi:hypothetical protein